MMAPPHFIEITVVTFIAGILSAASTEAAAWDTEVIPRSYYIVSDKLGKLGWTRANERCASLFPGGRLAQVLNENSEDLISQLLTSQRTDSGMFWIAMNDRSTEGEFTWHGGRPVDYVGEWMKGEMNNDRKRNCVMLRVKKHIIYWMFDRCGYRRNYICEYFSGPLECGKQAPPQLQSRIYEGNTAQVGMWPWQASLNVSGEHTCGAVLLDSQWLITAAQCVYDDEKKVVKDFGTMQIRMGNANLDESAWSELYSKVDIVEIHPKYESGYRQWDFALLHMPSPVHYTYYIRPACILGPEDTGKFDRCAISGWGVTKKSGASDRYSEKLKYAYVDIVDQEECDKAHPNEIYSDHMCTTNDGGASICSGDGGGPLVCKKNKKWFVVGVAMPLSGGCASKDQPSVFSRVSFAMPWASKKFKPE
ncbi:putative serine protease 45 [Ptychodera flava]|uniref:putative serine protease 45 n=1 Tax=Ptychodera flava TaxID=63121 RepID=UPI00396A2E49